MDVPGTTDEYREELYEALSASNYKEIPQSATRLDRIYRPESVFDAGTIGVIDGRNITPESLEDATSDLYSAFKEHAGIFGKMNGGLFVVVGTCDGVPSEVRDYISNYEGVRGLIGQVEVEIMIADVGAGAIVSKDHGLLDAGPPVPKIRDDIVKEPFE